MIVDQVIYNQRLELRYITYSKEDEAIRCIQSVHGYTLQGQPLRACFGTTKYCHAWLRNMATKKTVSLKTRLFLHIQGMDLQFEWDEKEAFVRQRDRSLFSWCERFRCFKHLIYGIVNKNESVLTLTFLTKEIKWKPGESLLVTLESEGVVKQVFPIHDEVKRKHLLKSWAFNWMDLTQQMRYTHILGQRLQSILHFLECIHCGCYFQQLLGLFCSLLDTLNWL